MSNEGVVLEDKVFKELKKLSGHHLVFPDLSVDYSPIGENRIRVADALILTKDSAYFIETKYRTIVGNTETWSRAKPFNAAVQTGKSVSKMKENLNNGNLYLHSDRNGAKVSLTELKDKKVFLITILDSVEPETLRFYPSDKNLSGNYYNTISVLSKIKTITFQEFQEYMNKTNSIDGVMSIKTVMEA